MKLVVTTPTRTVVEAADIRHVRADDPSGAFGILPGHADMLTALSVSVIAWRDQDGIERFVAVRGGILRVKAGRLIEIATREAVEGDDLRRLETEVVSRFLREAEDANVERAGETKMHLAAIRCLYDYARGVRGRRSGAARLRGARETEAASR